MLEQVVLRFDISCKTSSEYQFIDNPFWREVGIETFLSLEIHEIPFPSVYWCLLWVILFFSNAFRLNSSLVIFEQF